MARKGENIHKRAGDGRWEARCWYYDKETERSRYRYFYGKSYEEVKTKKEDFLRTLRNGATEKAEPKSLKQSLFNEVAEEWMNQISGSKKYSTYVKYEKTYRKHIEHALCGLRIGDLTEFAVQALVFDRFTASESTYETVYSILKQILKFAGENYNQLLPKRRTSRIKKHKATAEVLSREEQAKLIPFLYKDMDCFKMAILLDLNTGMRLGEICALKWSDIDFENGIIQVTRTAQRLSVEGFGSKTTLMTTEPKTVYSKRKIPVSRNVITIINSFRHDGEYVFCEKKPLEPRTLENHFYHILREAGIGHHRYHDLRHTFATNNIERGTDIKSLCELLGHSSVNTTMNLYVHPTIETKRKYIEAVDGYYSQFLT